MKEILIAFANPTAIIGLVGSIIILVAMCFNTRTEKGEKCMRTVNLVGSLIYVAYGLLLGINGIGTVILNAALVFVNMHYISKANNTNN
jgi:predicted methyltransferase MtxX (methanogen marker protein 4)